ncbi:hypothetical protein RHMOL_Rhmol11G0071100 [Rhododendron molle]|uniref:Uncharacterized protein n=1 Tax=Rhododendron molle TaxID=49168 RepID=A0ACC0LPE0_RHOML|nr:hypothetical protein RHMOL_Rhmol11G0071100 [Rhododendron molle]
MCLIAEGCTQTLRVVGASIIHGKNDTPGYMPRGREQLPRDPAGLAKKNKSQARTMNPEKWVFILILPFLFFRFCSSIDGNLLVSSGETFALGFFSPENSSRRYVGIWYNKISERTVVWVANRDDPINGTTIVLSFNKNGNLEIYDHTRNLPVWDTNITAGSYSARLLDSGNLALFQGDSGSGGVV